MSACIYMGFIITAINATSGFLCLKYPGNRPEEESDESIIDNLNATKNIDVDPVMFGNGMEIGNNFPAYAIPTAKSPKLNNVNNVVQPTFVSNRRVARSLSSASAYRKVPDYI